MQTLSLKKKISLEIVGFTNLEILGKKSTLKIYKTKTSAEIAAVKLIAKAKIKAAKQFVEDFAKVLKGEALKAKVLAARKAMRLNKWSFDIYCKLLTALKNVRLFNVGVYFDLRVKL